MKLLWGLFVVVALIEGNNAQLLSVPDSFINFSGGLTGVYQNYLDDVSTLQNTFNNLSNLNASPVLTATASSFGPILDQILQLSGPVDVVRDTYFNLLPGFFAIINQAFSSLSNVVGPQVHAILLAEIQLLQSDISNALSRNVPGYIHVLLDDVENVLLSFDIVAILFAANINDLYADYIINTIIVLDTIFLIKEYALFLLAHTLVDPVVISYLNLFLSSGTQGVGFVAEDALDAVSNAVSRADLTNNAVAAAGTFVGLTFNFMTADNSIPNVFAGYPFTGKTPQVQLAQIATALNNVNTPIANYNGAQIYETITSAFNFLFVNLY